MKFMVPFPSGKAAGLKSSATKWAEPMALNLPMF
jgi:hypothetical protein